MNHIYKSIFNKALGVFTAVPEFASAHGKGSERTVVGRVAKGTAGFAASALAISVGLALTSTSAVAGPGIYINDGTDASCFAIPDAQNPNVGIHGISGGTGTVSPALSILGSSQVVPGNNYYALDVMKPCLSSTGANAAEHLSTQTNRTLFYGNNSYGNGTLTNNGAKNLTLGGRLDVNSGIIGVGDRGTNGAGATNSIRMGTGTTLADANKKLNSISIGVDTGASDANAIAIGANTSAAGSNSSAIGLNAKATTDSSIAIGTSSEAGGPATSAALLGTKAIAIGYETKALGTSNVALGYGSVAENGHDSIAIGIKAKTSNLKSISIGAYSEASGAQSTVISNNYGSATGAVSTASGTRSQIYGAETTVSGEQSVSIGDTNTIASARTYALGNNINIAAGADDSLVFGTKAGVGGANAIALGNTAKATQDNSIAQGTESATYGKQSVSIGYKAVSGLTAPTASQTNAFSVSIGNETEALDASTVAIGDKAKAKGGVDALAVGTQANAMTYKALAIGAYSQATGRQSTVIGNDIQGQPSIASGTRSQIIGVQSNVSGDNSVSIGDTNTIASARTYAMGNNINVKAGINDALAFGTRASVQVAKSIAMGENATAGIDDGITTSYVRPSVAIGAEAKATGKGSVSIGHESASLGESATALGIQATALGKGQTSLGLHAGHSETGDQVNQQYGVFIGRYAGGDNQNPNVATEGGNIYGIAIGESAGRYGQGGSRNTAIGEQAGQYVKGSHNIAMGTQAGTGTDAEKLEVSGTTAIGNTAKALTNDSVAIGTRAKSGKVDRFSGERSVAIGAKAEALGTGGIAIGDSAATTDGHNGVAIGVYSKTQNEKAISIGAFNKATGAQSIVIAGNYDTKNSDGVSTATAARAIAMGAETNVSGEKSVAIGDTNTIASARTYALGNNINVAAGADDSLVFGSQANVGAVHSIAMGTTAAATGISSIALGKSASATEQRAIAMGENALAGNEASMALGYNSSAKGSKQVSIGLGAGALKNATDAGAELATFVGHYAGADNASPTGNAQGVAVGVNAGRYGVSGIRNVAVGPNTGQKVEGDDNTAIGYNSGRGVKGTNNFAGGANAGVFVEGNNNVALGFNAGIGAEAKPLKVNRTTAVGSDSRALADDSVALGDHAIANNANSVAIGTRSTTSDIHTGDYTLNNSYTAAGLPNAANGTVSVGAAGKERQIQNVAAGVISATSTDAINGSQLYATNNYMSNFATGVKNVLGGDAAVDNAGNLTMSNIGGTGKGNVNDAIAAANTKVAAGDNITVTPTTNADGSKTYTVATKKDLVVDSVKAGDTTVNTDGVTIAGGPSVKKDGINAGDKKITGVANGNVAAGSKDAVNGGQLAEVKAKADSAVQNVVSANPTALTATKAGDTVTLTPNFIAGDLVNADGTVKDPAAADEGKLVSAKTVADALKANHFVVDTKANGGTVDAASEENAKVGSGNKVTFEAGKNLVAQQTNTANGGATVNYKLSDTLENLVSVKSAEIEAGIGPNKVVLNNNGVKVGDSTLNDKGLTINNGPSVTDAGIDAGNKKITGVADGNVAAGSTDAVNGGQLAAVKAKADSAVQDVKSGDENALTAVKDPNTNIVTVTPKLSGDLVDTNGNITAPTTPEEKGKLVTAGTVAEALANTHFVVDTKATDGELDAASQADQKIKASNKVTLQAGKNLKAKQTNGANGAEVEFSLKDSISLKEVKVGEGSANEVVLNNNGVNVAGNTYINKDGLNANDKKITNVAPGAVTAASKDAVNGSQLYNVANNVKDLIGPDAAIDPATGKVTVADPAKGIGETGKGNIGDAIKHVNDAAKAAAETAAKHTTVVEGKNVKVTKGKNAAGGDEYTVATKDDLDVTSVTAGNTTVNNNGLTITGGPSVTRGGIDAGNRVISDVKAGDVSANSKEAVNGSQLHATNTKLDGVKAKADTAVQDVKSGDENALTAVKDPNTNIVTVTPKLSGNLVDANGNITAPTTPADKGKLVTAGTVADALANTHFVVDTKATDGELDAASQADQKIKAGNKVTLQAGKNLKAKQTNGADGAQVEFSLKDSISLKEVTAGEGANQVVLNDKGVNVGGNTYINNDGLNANGNKITNVADGVDPKDAVNKGQLDAVKGVADSAVKSVDVANGEQNLVVDNSDPKNPKLSLKKDLTVDSVKAGDSTLNNDGLTIAGGPSVKKDGINAGDKKITNVAAGDVAENSKDAVNGGQLYDVAKNVADLVGPDATIDPATGKVTVADPAQGIAGTGKGTIGEAIKSVKDKADTAVQDIKSGDEKALSVTKAGNTYTITPNLSGDLVDANGNITAPTTPADKGKLVTAGTVADALANTHFVVDTKATDGELDAASQADQKIKAGNKVTLQAGKNLKAKQTNGTNGAQVEFSLKDSISLTQVTAGTGDNQVVLGNDGVQVGGNTYINKDGLNANNKVISNVADGVNPNDAVNKGQLDAVGKEAAKHTTVKAGKNVEVAEGTNAAGGKEYTVKTADNLDVTSVKAGDSTLNTDGLTIAGGPSVKKDGINAGDKKITNVAPGAVTPTSKDAVNGSQLYNVANNVKDLIGPDATIDPATGKVTVADPIKGIGGTGKGNIGDAIQSVKDAADKAAAEHTTVKAGKNIEVEEGTNAAGGKEYTVKTADNLDVTSVKAGDTTVNNDGLTIAGGPSVKKDGIDAGDKKITNVADGVDAADAVNKGQLDKVAQNVVNVLGGNATVNGNGDITMSNIGDTGKGNVNDAIKAVNDLAKKAAAEKTSVKAKDGRSNVTVTEGVNAAGGHEYTVDVERSVTNAGSDYVTVTNNHDADTNTTTYTVDVSAKTKASLAKADSAVQGLTSKDGNLNFTKGANGNVEVSFNDNLNVKNVTTDRVQVANGPSMSKDGINAAGKAISNVANGNVAKGSKDAVNGGQLHETAQSVADVIGGGATVKDGKVVAGQNGIGNTGQNTVHGAIAAINQNTANNFNQIRGDLRKMDRDLRGGIAGALATAGLPQAFRPGKSMVAAAASTYRGQSGLAIGVSRISDNGKVILKVTGNTNSRGDFGGTIGAGYQW